jgi:hypothetical protein
VTGGELLDAVLADARQLVDVDIPVPRQGTETFDLAMVATALLRAAYMQAAAVRAVVDTETPEAASPNLRSLYEAVGELHQLLKENQLAHARLAYLFALREVRAYLAAAGDSVELREVDRELERLRDLAPAEYSRAMASRENYWSGKRAKLVRAGFEAIASLTGMPDPTPVGAQLYKLLSWDDHHVMAPMLNVQTLVNSANFGRVKRSGAVDDPEEFIPQMAAFALGGCLKLYRQAFPEVPSRRRAT